MKKHAAAIVMATVAAGAFVAPPASAAPAAVTARVEARTTVCTTAKGRLRATHRVSWNGHGWDHLVELTPQAKVYRKGGPVMLLFPYTYKADGIKLDRPGRVKRISPNQWTFTTRATRNPWEGNPRVTARWKARHTASFHNVYARCTTPR